MNILKKAALFILIVTLCISMTSCWNYREINDLSVISGMSMEKNKETGEFIITVEKIGSKKQEAQTKGAKGSTPPEYVQVTGKTISKALKEVNKYSGKNVYLEHVKVIIISEEIASEGIADIMDFFIRSADIRLDIQMLVADKVSPADIFLVTGMKSNKMLGLELMNLFQGKGKVAIYKNMDLLDITSKILAKTGNPLIPLIELIPQNDYETYRLDGLAVFKKDKMIGKMSEEEAVLLQMITDETKGINISFDKSESGIPEDISILIRKSSSRQKVIFINGKPVIQINLRMNCSIEEIDGSEDILSEDKRDQLKSKLERYMEGKIAKFVSKAQKTFKSDVFGFGETVMINKPELWEQIEGRWDEIFTELGTEINVDIDIEASGRIPKTIEVGG